MMWPYNQLILQLKAYSLPEFPALSDKDNFIIGRENSSNKVSLGNIWQFFEVNKYAG